MINDEKTKLQLSQELEELRLKNLELEEVNQEQVQVIAELKKGEKKFREIAENMRDMVSQIDGYGVFRYVSPSHRNFLGYRPEDMLGANFLDFMHPDDLELALVAFQEAMSSDKESTIELRFRHADGHYLWLDCAGNVLMDDDGNITGQVAASRVVSERKRVEEELRKLSSAVEQSPGMIMITDSEGAVEYINPMYSKVTGFNYKELIGKDVVGLARKSPGQIAQIMEMVTDGKQWRGQFQNIKKNGDLFWESVSISPIRDPDGSLSHFLIIGEDITERRELARDLARRNRELESILYTASHDFKSPVVTIVGFTDLLIERFSGALPENAGEYIVRIQNAGLRLKELMSDLIDLTRAEQEKASKEEISFASILDQALTEFKTEFLARNIRFKADGSFPKVVANPVQLTQVLENIISNSLNFMGDNNSPCIEVGWRNGSDHLTFFVRDNGIGIKQDQHDKIFDAFHRIGEVKCEGTGIGLALVKLIIEQHGGKVWVESEEGQGTSLYFTLLAGKSDQSDLLD